jgi:hypothetical protein
MHTVSERRRETMAGKMKRDPGSTQRARLGIRVDNSAAGRLGLRVENANDDRRPQQRKAPVPVETDEDTLSILQKFYDHVEADPQLKTEFKDTVAGLLARFYHQEEPGFTLEDAREAIIRDYRQVVTEDISTALPPEEAKRGPKPPSLEEVLGGRPFSPRDFMVGPTPRGPQGRMPQGRMPQSRMQRLPQRPNRGFR